MKQALLSRFITIRWKLTGAFVMVALVLGLTLTLLLVAAILFVLNASFVPDIMGRTAYQYANVLSAEFTDPEGSPERLIERLRVFVMTNPGEDPPANSDPNQQDLLVALLDTSGRVITTTHPLVYGYGIRLTDHEPKPAQDLVQRTISGQVPSSGEGAWTTPDRQPIGVAPVVGRAGEVIGVVYVRSLSFPSFGIFADLWPFLLTLLVPWLLISGGLGALYAWLVGRGFSRRLKSVADISVAFAAGDMTRRVDDSSADEIGHLGQQFNHMADRLAESFRSLGLLAERNAQLAEQAAQLAAVEERNRLARELHDSVSQELFSLTMLAAATRRMINTNPDQATAQLSEIEGTARRALEETRSLIFALRPAALDDRGLAPSLRELCKSYYERQGLKIDLTIEGERRLPFDYEHALFRIAQEALTNVARHSGSRAAEVSLVYGADTISLEISDQGRGMETTLPRNPQAVGLHSMAERAEALNGSCEVESQLGQGTTIRVTIPFVQKEQL